MTEILPEDFRLSHDPKTLLREVDAAIKIKDISKIHRYRDQVELKWWESGIVLLLFISGLGFMITIYKLIPHTTTALFWFVFFWFALFTMALIATIEFILLKIHALRQLYEIHNRLLERMERELDSHHSQADKAEEAGQKEKEKAEG